MPGFDDDAAIRKLVRTIDKLRMRFPNGWVPWRIISREQEGSEEFVDLLSGLGELPQWRKYFACGRGVVRLTEEGLHFAASAGETQLSAPQLIGSAVKDYARTLNPIRLRVGGIYTVNRGTRRIIQAIQVEIEDSQFPSETPVDFRPINGGGLTHGRIVGHEPDGRVLYIAFESEVLECELPAILTIDRGFLLHHLGERIETLEETPKLVAPVINGRKLTDITIRSVNSVELVDGLGQLRTPWVRFLWGPPGSGKTFALASFAKQILRKAPASKILLVAPSNRAVDVAIQQCVNQIEASELKGMIEERKILRFGYPRLPQVIERPELLGPVNLDELSLKQVEISKTISKAERDQKSEAEIASLRANLLEVQEEIKSAVDEHIKQSRVVATTTTLAYLGKSPIWNLKWDTVLVDEVTMVPPAMCVFLGSLATARFLLAGDPRQLGPVFEDSPKASQSAKKWMGSDIFEVSGVSQGFGQDRKIDTDDSRLTQITSQRRCIPIIWGKVQHLYPHIESVVDLDRLQKLANLPPLSGEPIVVLDSGSSATCQKVHRSWQNEYSADLAMEVAAVIMSEAPSGTSLAIISPYRAQNVLLRRIIRMERSNNALFECVEAGTVHQFQGSEADIVIFDVVDGIGRFELGNLLRNDTGARLVNVAITRAKGKCVILANVSWFKNIARRADNPLLYDLVTNVKGHQQLVVSPPLIEKGDGICESPIEFELYEAMSTSSDLSSVRRQYLIRDDANKIISRADFAFPELKYAVYCDGAEWHLKPDRWQRDLRQRNELAAMGWVFTVFPGAEVKKNPDKCAGKVAETLRNLVKRSKHKK